MKFARADRLSALPKYVFARLDELKARAREQGIDLIDLGMGNPDGPTPAPVVEAARAALGNPDYHRYPQFEGTTSFRQAIAAWYARRYGVSLDPESEALPTIGSKEGLAHLALAYLNPGDTVLVPSPAYPTHFRGPAIAGARVHSLTLTAQNDWLIDLSAIPEAVARSAKMLYFNYPSNPTTATAPREFFEEIVAFARHYEIMLVHDLCYAELAFDGYQPTSLLEIPGAKELGVEFHTLSKTYNMAGWRVGFVVGNEKIVQGLRTIKTNLDYGLFSVVQEAAKTALNLPESYVFEAQERYRQRRDFAIAGLGKLGWNVPKSKATMYLWVPCPVGANSTDFALNLLQKTGVVVTPGNAFGEAGEGYVRISLIADRDRLGEALRRWEQAGIRYQPEAVSPSQPAMEFVPEGVEIFRDRTGRATSILLDLTVHGNVWEAIAPAHNPTNVQYLDGNGRSAVLLDLQQHETLWQKLSERILAASPGENTLPQPGQKAIRIGGGPRFT